MKKIFAMLAATAALSFTACTGNNEGTTMAEGMSTEITADNFQAQLDSLVGTGDTTAIQALITQSQEQAKRLIADGDTTAAMTLIEKVKEVLNTQKDKIVALAPSLTEAVNGYTNNLPDAIKDIVNAGVDSIAKAAIEEGKAQLEEAGATIEDAKADIEEAKAKVEDVKAKVEDAKAKAQEGKAKVEDAASKAKNAAQALKNLGK